MNVELNSDLELDIRYLPNVVLNFDVRARYSVHRRMWNFDPRARYSVFTENSAEF